MYFKQWKEGIYYNFGIFCLFLYESSGNVEGWFIAFALLADTQQEIIIFQESLASILVI